MLRGRVTHVCMLCSALLNIGYDAKAKNWDSSRANAHLRVCEKAEDAEDAAEQREKIPCGDKKRGERKINVPFASGAAAAGHSPHASSSFVLDPNSEVIAGQARWYVYAKMKISKVAFVFGSLAFFPPSHFRGGRHQKSDKIVVSARGRRRPQAPTLRTLGCAIARKYDYRSSALYSQSKAPIGKRSEIAGSVGCRCGSSLLAEAVPRRWNSRMDSCAPRIQPSVLREGRIAARLARVMYRYRDCHQIERMTIHSDGGIDIRFRDRDPRPGNVHLSLEPIPPYSKCAILLVFVAQSTPHRFKSYVGF